MKITLENLYKLIVEQGKRTDERFARQFAHFDNEIKAIHKRLDQTATKADIDRLLSLMDKYGKRLDEREVEAAAAVSQTTRHETWIRKVAYTMASYLKFP